MTGIKFNLQWCLLLSELGYILLLARLLFFPRHPFINKWNLILSMILSLMQNHNKIDLVN